MSVEATVLISAAVVATLAVAADLAYKYLPKFHAKADAEALLLKTQAAHVAQTIQSEASLLEANIKAYETQGVNKVRDLLVKAKGDVTKIETALRLSLSSIGLVSSGGSADKAAVAPAIPAQATAPASSAATATAV